MKENNCPECGKVTNRAESIEDGSTTPEVGDISLCLYCGSINQFDADLNIHPVADGVMDKIKEEDLVNYEVIMNMVSYIKEK